jgi:putative transcriptional regulator
MEENMSDFVRKLRRQLGMTQEEFAHALGITVGTVNRWENKRFRPSKLARSTIVEFARRHGVSTTIAAAEAEDGAGITEHDESFH